jgi:hypothetical protein
LDLVYRGRLKEVIVDKLTVSGLARTKSSIFLCTAAGSAERSRPPRSASYSIVSDHETCLET